MKVALATDWFLPRLGGMELHLADLARALAARGVDVGIVTTTPGAEMSDGLAVRRLQPLLLPKFDLAISPRLVEMLKAEFVAGRYDVIHAHISVFSPVGYGAVLAAHALGLPTVVTFRGILLRSAQFLQVTDRLMGWSGWPLVVTAVSGVVADQFHAAVPRLPVTVLPNGVEGAFWRAAASVPKSVGGDIAVISAMRLNRKKRPTALLDAFARARAKAALQGRRMSLEIAGKGPLRAGLERHVAKRGLSDAVTFLGAVSRQTLADHYRHADLFAMPSIHESFGIAALEARSAGLPVLGRRQAGIGEFLRHGETAMLARDDVEFAHFLERLALDDELRLRLARTDPRLERFEWPEIAEAHLACFERALALARR